MKGPIQSLTVSYILHATEDEKTVLNAVRNLVSGGAEPAVEELEGHFGNRIAHVSFHLTGDAADEAFSRVVWSLSEDAKAELMRTISSHIDEHSALFLRLDKQSVVSGKLLLGETDPVRVKVKPRAFMLKGGGPRFYSDLIRSAK